MHLSQSDTTNVEGIIIEAARLGGITLMKNVSITRNRGKTPEYVLAECMIAAFRMWQSQGDNGDEPA